MPPASGRQATRRASSRTGAKAPSRPPVPLDQVTAEPVVLVTGGEDLLADRAVTAVVTAARRGDPETRVERLDAAAYEAGRLTTVTSPSLFGGGVVVVASGVEHAVDAFVTDATAYLADPAPEVSLVLRHSGGQRAKALLDRFGLEGRYGSRPTQLSGGQCQRVAIARALANDPPVILADEPTGNLDEKTGLEVLSIFQELHRSGKTIIMVTHNPAYRTYATQAVTIHDGRASEA